MPEGREQAQTGWCKVTRIRTFLFSILTRGSLVWLRERWTLSWAMIVCWLARRQIYWLTMCLTTRICFTERQVNSTLCFFQYLHYFLFHSEDCGFYITLSIYASVLCKVSYDIQNVLPLECFKRTIWMWCVPVYAHESKLP